MFDDHHRVAALGQAAQNLNQLVHVREMQTRGGLVQHVDGLARAALGQLRCQLDALGLAPGQLRGGLSQADIPQSHVVERLNLPGDGRHVLKEFQRVLHGHIQHVVDALALILHIQGLPVIALAAADLAGHVHVRQEMHLDLDNTVAAARLAASALDVEAETALAVTLGLGVRGGGEQVPDQVEHARVGGRVGPGGAPDGGLVDGDDLVQLFHALDALVPAGNGSGPVQLPGQGLVENLVNQRTLAGAGNAGDAGHHAQREVHVNVLQVVLRSPLHRNPTAGLTPLGRHRNLHAAAQVSAGDRLLALHDILRRADGHHLSAVLARSGADIHNAVRCPHGVLVVFHHQNAVAQIPQMQQGL